MPKCKHILFSGFLAVFLSGCIKETYDMNKLSEEIHLSPTFVIAGVKGNVRFSDLVKSSDTIVFDQNNFVKVIYRKDSIINLQLSDFFDLNNMITFRKSYELGVLDIGSFQGSLSVALNQITQNMPSALRGQIAALDDGSTHLFPTFPSVNLDERNLSTFQNFDNAVFESGYLDITLTNNLTTPLNSVSINLLNSYDRSFVGTVNIPPVAPGQSQTSSVDLSDRRVTSSLIAGIELSGSSGTSAPVIVSLDNSNISVTARGRDLKVKSGRIMIPVQPVNTLDNKDTVDFDPGSEIELDKIRIATGEMSYTLTSGTLLSASISIKLPTVIANSLPVSHTITTGISSEVRGSINLNATEIDLGSDTDKPFNRIPLEYQISVGSGGGLVNYTSADKIEINFSLKDPDFDYVKGYFGQKSESIKPDTLDLDIDDILNRISGSFLISSPVIKLNYSNSFAIPLKMDFQAKGKRGNEIVNLGLDPIIIASPEYPESRDIISSIVIDKNNSDLAELISLPPGQLFFSGAAIMNPGGNNGLRNDYVFGNSRFIGSAEVEVPMEFRMNGLQFSDTIDNFLKVDDEDNPLNPENFKNLELNLIAKNEFPLGVAVKLTLFNSETNTKFSSIDASSLLGAAPVDANGKSAGNKETTTNLKLSTAFFEDSRNADKIIIWFTLNTSNNGTSDVKIYSDYKIQFRTSLLLKPELIFN